MREGPLSTQWASPAVTFNRCDDRHGHHQGGDGRGRSRRSNRFKIDKEAIKIASDPQIRPRRLFYSRDIGGICATPKIQRETRMIL
jgi:hypothetical protein